MNYRHAFHAGNFADLVKHAALLRLLDGLTRDLSPLTVIDTHAGRGVYDLAGPEARKSGEAEAGIVRLMAADGAPAAFGPLVAAVRKLNNGEVLHRYPGSPWLVATTLRAQDAGLVCELRPDDYAALADLMKARRNIVASCADGYQSAVARAAAGERLLVLIDPPFERADDYERVVATVAGVRARNPAAIFLIWVPLKDLETFDAFLRDLEDVVAAPALVAETRMRPLTDPMKMNGCGLVAIGLTGPAAVGLEADLEAVCTWTAQTLGDGGVARLSRLSGR